VENFPGLPEGVDGPVRMESMRAQAEKFDAKMVYDAATRPYGLREMFTHAEFRDVDPTPWYPAYQNDGLHGRPVPAGGGDLGLRYLLCRVVSGSPALRTASAIQAMASGTS
jgi:hypothetical protein